MVFMAGYCVFVLRIMFTEVKSTLFFFSTILITNKKDNENIKMYVLVFSLSHSMNCKLRILFTSSWKFSERTPIMKSQNAVSPYFHRNQVKNYQISPREDIFPWDGSTTVFWPGVCHFHWLSLAMSYRTHYIFLVNA